MKRFAYIIALLIAGLLVHQASAQMMGEFEGERGPVHITSRQLEADYQKKLITFIGDVEARQQEFTLYADRLFLFLTEEGEEIEKILAQGHVRMVQGNREATCREATYYHREGKVILQGEPVVSEGTNRVRGKRIIYYIEEQRSVAESEGEERVTVTIIPHEEQQ
jgi:lipopolysaccharide export system protein LptA